MGGSRNGGWGGGDGRAGGPTATTSAPTTSASSAAKRAAGRGEGRQLRNMLREQNVDPKELDEIMRRLRELDYERVYQDVDELARLQTFVTEGLKRFEYELRRKVGDDADRALVTGSDEVPPEFKTLVEEYYRSLSKGASSRTRSNNE